jgi:hypothetical protein
MHRINGRSCPATVYIKYKGVGDNSFCCYNHTTTLCVCVCVCVYVYVYVNVTAIRTLMDRH